MTQLAHREEQTMAIQANPANPIAAMLQTIVESKITADTAATMEKLTDLYLKVEAENARKAFAAAKCAMQAELPVVAAMRVIPGNDGSVRSTFAAYEDIAEVVKPVLLKHGFSVSFTMRNETLNGKDRICAVCKLSHSGGHSETNEFSVRVSAPPKSSDAQADGATRSYARRGALCDCLDIVVDHDDDARIEGAFISPAEARLLESRVKSSGGDVAAFLQIAGARDFDQIRKGKLAVLRNMLTAKERAKKDPPAKTEPTTNTQESAPDGVPPIPITHEHLVDSVARLCGLDMTEAERRLKLQLPKPWAAFKNKAGFWARLIEGQIPELMPLEVLNPAT